MPGTFIRPHSLSEALDLLAASGGRILAGGTDVFPALGDRPSPDPLLDISTLGELRGIAISGDATRIGAATTWSEVVAHPLPPGFDGLKAAAREVGAIQIQKRGTVGGKLCNASPAADGVPPLLALDAEVELASHAGIRRLPLADFITGNRKTARRRDEIVTGVIVPRRFDDAASRFLKLGARRYLVISIVMVAATVRADEGGRVAEARIAVGSCSAAARRLEALEKTLVGAPATGPLGDLVAPGHLATLAPIDDVRATAAYRGDAAVTLVRRALDLCSGRTA